MLSGDGGVPVLGQLHDGNQSEHVTNRWQLSQLRQVVPKLEETTLVPASSNKRGEMIGRVVTKGVPLPQLRKTLGRRKGEEVFRSTSLMDEVEIERPQEEGKEQEPPVREPMPVRYLVVHSTQLERQHHRALEKSIAVDKEVLSKALEQLQKRPFSCKEDALRAAAKWTKTHQPSYHPVTFETHSLMKKAKRERPGRPGKDVLTQRPTTAVVFKHFQGLCRVRWEVDGQTRAFIQGVTHLHERILNLLGLSTKVFTLSAKILTAPT